MFSLSLNNYRSFQEEELFFSKINILIGENSSGKSSLFKLLLALKQTLITPTNREINLALTGELADLGSYKETIYYHQDNLPLLIKFGFDESYYPFFLAMFASKEGKQEDGVKELMRLNNYLQGPVRTETFLSYTFNKELDKHETIKTEINNPSVGNLIIHHSDEELDPNEKLLGTKCSIQYFDKETNTTFLFDNVIYQKDGFMSIIVGPSLHANVRAYYNIDSSTLTNSKNENNDNKEILEKVEKIFYKMAFLLVTQNFLKAQLEKLQYINPINTQPNRVYLYKDAKNTNNIKDIEDVVEFFSKSNDASKSAFDDFVQIIKRFGIAEELEIIKDSRLPVRELRVKVKDLLSNITDVGYGVSLQLPIILKALLSEKTKQDWNSVLLIEQPEVHLHPRLHAELIETLLSLSKHTTYFIETHSEHIIRKLQVLIKEKKYNIKPTDVSIHYLRRVKKTTEVTSHKINEDGFLEPMFPSGFFDNSYMLAKELLD